MVRLGSNPGLWRGGLYHCEQWMSNKRNIALPKHMRHMRKVNKGLMPPNVPVPEERRPTEVEPEVQAALETVGAEFGIRRIVGNSNGDGRQDDDGLIEGWTPESVEAFMICAETASRVANPEQARKIMALKGSGVSPLEATAAIVAAMGWRCDNFGRHHHHRDGTVGANDACGGAEDLVACPR